MRRPSVTCQHCYSVIVENNGVWQDTETATVYCTHNILHKPMPVPV